MIDAPAVIRSFLLAQSPIFAMTGNRIWADASVPGTGYTPSQGAAIVFRIRGGIHTANGSVIAPSVQFKFYGSVVVVNNVAVNRAGALYRAWYDVMRNGGGSGVKNCDVDVLGQSLEDEDTGWEFVLAFGSFWLNA